MSTILEAIGDVIEAVGGWLISAIQSVVSLFYTAPTSGGSGSLTFMGTLLIVGFGITLIWFAIKFVRGLVRLR